MHMRTMTAQGNRTAIHEYPITLASGQMLDAKKFLSTLTQEQQNKLWNDFRGADDSPLDYSWEMLDKIPRGVYRNRVIDWSDLQNCWVYSA